MPIFNVRDCAIAVAEKSNSAADKAKALCHLTIDDGRSTIDDRRTTLDVRVVRDGRRVRAAECDVVQDGRIVARATLVQYRRSSAPPCREWTASTLPLQLPEPDDSILPFVGKR